jgi:hypothetical protein
MLRLNGCVNELKLLKVPDVQPEMEMEEIVGSTDPAPFTSSAAAYSASLAEKAILALSPELAAKTIDAKSKARS